MALRDLITWSRQENRLPAGGTGAASGGVRFEPRCLPFVEPLTGWSGGRDPLAHVELRFHDRDAAERYCRSTGLVFRLGA